MKREQKFLISRLVVAATLFGVSFIPVLGNTLVLIICLVGFLIIGYDVIFRSLKELFKGEIFNERFLMLLASVGAFAIGEYHEAVAVMLLYQLGEFLQDLAVDHSKNSIKKLLDLRPDTANLVEEDGAVKQISPADAKVGDKIIVYAGEKVPLDGQIISGETSLDTSSLTGESLPRDVGIGDIAACGTINLLGSITIEVTRLFEESSVSKIIEMVENSEEKQAKTDKFITKFAKIYTPTVVCLAIILCLLPPLAFGLDWKIWINRALLFLVVSCPCALVISIPLTFFAGIGGASRQGVLFKGANHIETLAKLKVLALDKTGTLTKGNLAVTKIVAAGCDENEVLRLAAIAETGQTHPIAKSIMSFAKAKLGKFEGKLSEQTTLAGLGIKAKIGRKTIYAGNAKLMKKLKIEVQDTENASTSVFVASGKKLFGIIYLEDEVQDIKGDFIENLKRIGVQKIAILTGDKRASAEKVTEQLGIKELYAELLPEDKIKILLGLKSDGVTAYAGDGINDAPVLKLADVGIAMGKVGCDIAIDSADIVLMDAGPDKIVDAIKISKKTMKLAKENITFTIGFKVLMLVLGALGLASMWLAIFADVGVSLLAVLNACRAFKAPK